jgi:hypothetical protein
MTPALLKQCRDALLAIEEDEGKIHILDVPKLVAAIDSALAQQEAQGPSDAPSKWIPCSQSMPPDNHAVLVLCKDADDGEGDWIGAGFHVPEGWQSQDSIMLSLPLPFEVTHWMALPSGFGAL